MSQPYRQGDVLIIPVDSIPEDATPVAATAHGVVLAYGEQTGHHHAIADPSLATLFTVNDKTFLRVDAPAPLVHDEHEAFTIDPGNYQISRKREYVAPDGVRVATSRWVSD